MPPLVRSDSLQDIDFTLRRQFNKESFRYDVAPSSPCIWIHGNRGDKIRPHQREIILAALQGKDVFVQAATSFGKSLCFQLPAVIDRGSTCAESIINFFFITVWANSLIFSSPRSHNRHLTPPQSNGNQASPVQTQPIVIPPRPSTKTNNTHPR